MGTHTHIHIQELMQRDAKQADEKMVPKSAKRKLEVSLHAVFPPRVAHQSLRKPLHALFPLCIATGDCLQGSWN